MITEARSSVADPLRGARWALMFGNLLRSRHLDRFGAARAVAMLLAAIGCSMALWPLAGSYAAMAAVLVPWAPGSFASNSAQQARLGQAAPALAPAVMALNTSAIYLGQAVGASSGGAIVAAHAANGSTGRDLFAGMNWVALAWLMAAVALSLWADRKLRADAALGAGRSADATVDGGVP